MHTWACRRRIVRTLAAALTCMLVSAQVLAAAQLCAVRAAAPPAASNVECEEHQADPTVIDGDLASTPAEVQHCPTEEPTAQVRGVDLPAATVFCFAGVGRLIRPEPSFRFSAAVPPPTPQRFAQLSRLLL